MVIGSKVRSFAVIDYVYSRTNVGQQRVPTLLHPHSKLVLQEAIKNDSEFLSKSNIMDYSLLLGIDAEKKEIACGLVDTIGEPTI
jgi:1-phosphatidylinositol-3-phosphate 5-kinase